MISRRNAILLTLFGILLGGLLVYLSPTFKNPKLDIEFWAYITSIVIALCALNLTIWQLRSTINHNKLNMLPRLQVQVVNQLDFISKTDGLFEIKIINNGLGPAEIKEAYFEYSKYDKKFRFNLDHIGMDKYIDTVFRDDTDNDDIATQLKDLANNFLNGPYREINTFAKDQLISSNEIIDLMKLTIPSEQMSPLLTEEQKQLSRKKARKALKTTKIIIKYNSLYGDTFTFESYLQH